MTTCYKYSWATGGHFIVPMYDRRGCYNKSEYEKTRHDFKDRSMCNKCVADSGHNATRLRYLDTCGEDSYAY